MKYIEIPSSVKSIGRYAFNYLPSLTDIYYSGSEKEWNSISRGLMNHGLEIQKIHFNSKAPSFRDVAPDKFYALPVEWAVENGITSGTGNFCFSPNASCTRGQIVTFLWRAAGEPEPFASRNPFVDVKPSDYYYKAVLWAVENNITSGTGAGQFSPSAPCTRAQAVTFLWRAKGQPAGINSSFSDVPGNSFYKSAVDWAVARGITTGTGGGKFSPSAACTRGQIVTFLYRASDLE